MLIERWPRFFSFCVFSLVVLSLFFGSSQIEIYSQNLSSIHQFCLNYQHTSQPIQSTWALENYEKKGRYVIKITRTLWMCTCVPNSQNIEIFRTSNIFGIYEKVAVSGNEREREREQHFKIYHSGTEARFSYVEFELFRWNFAFGLMWNQDNMCYVWYVIANFIKYCVGWICDVPNSSLIERC